MTHTTRTLKLLTATIVTLAIIASGAAASAPASNLDATLINTDPVPLRSGDDGDIRLKIVNTGDQAAHNVTVRLQDAFPFTVMPDRQDVYRLGTVHPGQEYYISTAVLVAEGAPDGMNPFRLRLSSEVLTRQLEVPVEVEDSAVSLRLASIATAPATLYPGTDDASMTVSVTNTGEAPAENAVLELDLPAAFEQTSSFSSRAALGTVAGGATTEASFTFDVSEDLGAGPVTVPATVTYEEGEGQALERRNTSFTLYLEGRPQFEVVNVTESLRVGQTGSIRIMVRNTGSVESSSTRLRVLDNSDLPFSFDSASSYIGSLDPGETGTAVFSPGVESDAVVKEHLLDVEVRGTKDTTVFVDQHTVRLDVDSGSGGGLPVIPLAALGLLVVAGLGYVLRDRLPGRDDG